MPLIASALRHEALTAEGCHDAFQFALAYKGDLARITAELAEKEALLASFEDQGPMQPGAGPRIYRDGYLTGLRDAVAIVQAMQRQGKPWDRVETSSNAQAIRVPYDEE